MCGIAGIISNESCAVAKLQRMINALSHRGPDATGIHFSGHAGIAYSRLAIIDPDTGNQPLTNEAGTLHLVCNGEIYNYQELRTLLTKKGHCFSTQSDAEVIVHAWETWGTGCLNRLRGMFTFALLDTAQDVLFLVRDPLGIKPLVYYQDNKMFAFASEIQALKTLPGIDLSVNLAAIDHYLQLQYIPAPASAYCHIKKLQPAHYMRVNLKGNNVDIQPYWQLTFRPKNRRKETDWLKELDHVLEESVRYHMQSDVPFGAFLSGGIDSTLILKYMSRIQNRPVDTFSLGFDHEDFNELQHSNTASQQYKSNHHDRLLNSDTLDILPQLMQHYGEPFGDSSAIPTWYLSQMAAQKVKMVLSGDGGDEVFLGYQLHASWHSFLQQNQIDLPQWKQKLQPLARSVRPLRYPEIHYPENDLNNWYSLINYFTPSERQALWRTDFHGEINQPNPAFEEQFQRAREIDPVQRAQYMDITTYLPFDILTKVDRASMVHGLEVRTPFADVKVLEFAATMPWTMNLHTNGNGKAEGKWLLKKLLQPDFNPRFLHRKKQGFAVPLSGWFSGREEEIKSRLRRSDHLNNWFNTNYIEILFKNKQFRKIWLLLVLDEWLRQP